MKKHKTSERNTPLALTIGLLLIISVFAMSSCAKHKAKEESEPTLADSSVTTAEKTEPSDTTSLTDGSSETSGEVTDTSASSSVSEEPTESFTDSINFNPSDSDSTAPSGAETTPGTGSTDTPSGNPTKAPKATATPKPKATATPKPKATATPAPKENTPTPVPKENTPTPKPQPKPSGDASSSIELSSDFSHTRPNGSSGKDVIFDVGFSSYLYRGECIAAGPGSISAVYETWKNSDGHYKIMTKDKANKMGIGYATVNGTTYWCLLVVGV